LLSDLAHELGTRVVSAVRAAFGLEITVEQALIRPAAPGRGADFQSNVAMALAKRLGRPSPEVANAVVEHLDLAGLRECPQVAGPGFINIAFDTEVLARHVAGLGADERLGFPETTQARRVVIDYSSPNMAKEMHVGHLRSTIIGDALSRLLEHAGHEVIRQNHLGDWGTPFGMLVEYLSEQGHSGSGHSVADLTAFYAEARQRFDADQDFADRARKRVVALQAGDPTTLALWQELLAESKRHIEAVYALLDVRLSPADYHGESAHNAQLAEVAAELENAGLAQVSEGALCLFPPGFTGRDDQPLPLIIRKRDGGFGYAATDLATIRHRTQDLKGDWLIYVVGAPQKLHFDMIFTAARQAAWLVEGADAVHVPFGSVLGSDGRMLRTREGGTIKLTDLLTEAVDRAEALLAERDELAVADRAQVAQAVGIGAVKYADLSSDRERDYVFDYDRMLAMDGNTAVYLQYAHARIRSLLRKADQPDGVTAPLVLTEASERSLALKLAAYPAALTGTLDALQPHRLTTYLYELAATYSSFYEHCPVLTAAEPATRESRLALSTHTARVLAQGLCLLGITAPTRL
jgi:arginyl-tRNA synthetase